MDNFANHLRSWLDEISDTPKTTRRIRTTTSSARSARDSVRIGNFNLRERELLAGCDSHVWEVAQKGCQIFNAEVIKVEDIEGLINETKTQIRS